MDRAHRGGDWAEPHVEDATSRLDLGAERGSDGSEKCAMEKHLPFSQCATAAKRDRTPESGALKSVLRGRLLALIITAAGAAAAERGEESARKRPRRD
jgi:hypothetical protein